VSPDQVPVDTFEVVTGGTSAAPVLGVRGEIDVATAPVLRTALTRVVASGATTVTVEMSGVTFLDSSGIGVLLGAHRRLREERDGSLRVTGARETVRRVLDITGLSDTFALGGRDERDASPDA
jgi:anti-sigma B factor antagonist